MNGVSVIGTTTWGTCLAGQLARNGVTTTLLARTELEATNLQSQRQHTHLLPGYMFPQNLTISSDIQSALSNTSLVILAVPSQTFRQNIRLIKDHLAPGQVILSASKGLEKHSGKRMTQIMEDELPERLRDGICVLSGPNLAMEIIDQKPSSAVVAARNINTATRAQSLLMSRIFRVYTNNDIIGVEFGGALKNIIAIGCGIIDGLKYGDNSKAGLITRGLAEVTRMAVRAGANPLTFSGLAGMGDLVATCSSRLSRNHYLGSEIARGRNPVDVLTSMKNVAEGVSTTSAAIKLARELEIEMPITQATHSILFGELDVKQAITELMDRPATSE